MPGSSRTTYQQAASPVAGVGLLEALNSETVAEVRVPGLSSAAALRGCSPPVRKAGKDQRDAGPDATSADSAIPGPTTAAVQPEQRNNGAALDAAPPDAGQDIMPPAAAVEDGLLGQDAAAAEPETTQPSATAWEPRLPEPDIVFNYEHEDQPGDWGDDYSDQWGYRGISPGPSFTPEPDVGGQLGATAESAPAASCPRYPVCHVIQTALSCKGLPAGSARGMCKTSCDLVPCTGGLRQMWKPGRMRGLQNVGLLGEMQGAAHQGPLTSGSAHCRLESDPTRGSPLGQHQFSMQVARYLT